MSLLLFGADEELRTVSVGSGIRHRKHTETGMLQGETLIGELFPIYRFTSGAIVGGKIASLAHLKLKRDKCRSIQRRLGILGPRGT